MQSIKNIKFYFQLVLYNIIKFLVEFFVRDHHERKELFIPRLLSYLNVLVLFYIIYAHIEFVFIEYSPYLSYIDRCEVKKTKTLFISVFILYNIYFFFSLIFVPLYKYAKDSLVSLCCIAGFCCFYEYPLFLKLEMLWFLTENSITYFVIYAIMFTAHLFAMFAIDSEEEHDDARELHANTHKMSYALQAQEWYDEMTLEEKRNDPEYKDYVWKFSKVTKNEEFLISIFGNPEDLGENPIQVANRYNFHKRKMYPEYFKTLSSSEEAFEALKERYAAIPDTIVEMYIAADFEYQKIRHIYDRRVLPWIQKLHPVYRLSLLFISIYRLRLFFYKPKVVGLYSYYNPYFVFNSKWIKNTYANIADYRRWFYRLANSLYNLFFYFSIFKALDNRKWTKFHLKYYTRSLRLRRRRSGNYRYFKPK